MDIGEIVKEHDCIHVYICIGYDGTRTVLSCEFCGRITYESTLD